MNSWLIVVGVIFALILVGESIHVVLIFRARQQNLDRYQEKHRKAMETLSTAIEHMESTQKQSTALRTEIEQAQQKVGGRVEDDERREALRVGVEVLSRQR